MSELQVITVVIAAALFVGGFAAIKTLRFVVKAIIRSERDADMPVSKVELTANDKAKALGVAAERGEVEAIKFIKTITNCSLAEALAMYKAL